MTPEGGTVRLEGVRPVRAWHAAVRRLAGFAGQHAVSTAVNMGFTFAQLLVLARILPLDRYAEIVFLTATGFYVQPISQVIGRANFLVLRAGRVAGRADGRPDFRLVLAGQATVVLFAALAVPSALAPINSARWVGDVLFLFLSLSFNVWAFDLQSTAWALDRALAFIRLTLLQRSAHFVALALMWWTGNFLIFAGFASLATAVAIAVVLRLFTRAGLFARTDRIAWKPYLALTRTSILATLVDFVVLNAPYAIVGARFGIGPTLIAFDCTMKLARITMAGARTLAEIALPRHSRLVALDQSEAAHRLYVGVCLLGLCGAAVPALALLIDGRLIFSALLGSNNVVPTSAAIPAAAIVLISGLYQSVIFFLGYMDRAELVQRLVLAGLATLGALALALWTLPLDIPGTLGAFALGFLAVTIVATDFANHRSRTVGTVRKGLFATAAKVVGF